MDTVLIKLAYTRSICTIWSSCDIKLTRDIFKRARKKLHLPYVPCTFVSSSHINKPPLVFFTHYFFVHGQRQTVPQAALSHIPEPLFLNFLLFCEVYLLAVSWLHETSPRPLVYKCFLVCAACRVINCWWFFKFPWVSAIHFLD